MTSSGQFFYVLVLTDSASLEVIPKNIQNKWLKHSCSNQVKLFYLEISFLIKRLHLYISIKLELFNKANLKDFKDSKRF